MVEEIVIDLPCLLMDNSRTLHRFLGLVLGLEPVLIIFDPSCICCMIDNQDRKVEVNINQTPYTDFQSSPASLQRFYLGTGFHRWLSKISEEWRPCRDQILKTVILTNEDLPRIWHHYGTYSNKYSQHSIFQCYIYILLNNRLHPFLKSIFSCKHLLDKLVAVIAVCVEFCSPSDSRFWSHITCLDWSTLPTPCHNIKSVC